MDINSLEQSIAVRHFLESLPDPVEEGHKFYDWLNENIKSFWSIICSEDVDLYYVRYVDGWTDSVLFRITLDDKDYCNVCQSTVRTAVDPKTREVYFSSPENWTFNCSTFGPDHFFWRVYDIMDKVHKKSCKFKLVNDGRFKTKFGTLLENIINK